MKALTAQKEPRVSGRDPWKKNWTGNHPEEAARPRPAVVEGQFIA
jgi:hypothetical protein